MKGQALHFENKGRTDTHRVGEIKEWVEQLN